MKIKVAIMGYGFVGKATEYFLKTYCPNVTDIQIQDPAMDLWVEDWDRVDYTFICVPTPQQDRKLDISYVIDALNSCSGKPIVRSTVGPEQVNHLNSIKRIILWPEFLREKTWKEDTDNSTQIILGVGFHIPNDLFALCGRKIKTTTLGEASLFKMSRNAMLAAKVAQANMLYDLCQKFAGVEYNNIKELLISDGTLGTTHFDVPGHHGRGFSGKCLPKDTTHYESLFKELNLYTEVLDYNETL